MKEDLDTLSQVTVLSDLLKKQNEIRNVLETRANTIIGLNSVLILFLINYHNSSISGATYIVALATLILSLFCALLAIKPPTFLRKKGQEESIFYHDHISSHGYEKYHEEANSVVNDKQKIFDSYILESYNLSKYSNVPKKFYAHLSLRILIYGVFLTILTYIISGLLGVISS